MPRPDMLARELEGAGSLRFLPGEMDLTASSSASGLTLIIWEMFAEVLADCVALGARTMSSMMP